MDIIIILLLVIGVAFVSVSWARADLKCPAPKIVYRYIPKHTLDVQFGTDNNPSEIFKDMFTKSSPWIGGFGMGNKAFASEMRNRPKKETKPQAQPQVQQAQAQPKK
jgi:hypothetical protein